MFNRKSNLLLYAKSELDLLGVDKKDKKRILKVIKAWGSYGDSGSSHDWFLQILTSLLRFKPLTPLTSDPSEWYEVGSGIWQNMRDGEMFSINGGKTWSNRIERNWVDKND